MKVLIAQLTPEFSVERNKDRIFKILKRDADLYVFPELYLTGYMVRDDMSMFAIEKDDENIQEIAEHSEGKIVIFGFPERDDFLYNSAAVIHDGEVSIARKLHLPNFGPFEEKLYFREGKTPFVIETEFGKIGVQICYDAFFPEVAKYQALQGSDIIINISASPITSRALFESIIPARAIENTVFFVYVNWAGLQRSMEFWGGSMVYSPRGARIHKSPYFEESIAVVNVDMDEIDIARRFRPTLRDSRKDILSLL